MMWTSLKLVNRLLDMPNVQLHMGMENLDPINAVPA